MNPRVGLDISKGDSQVQAFLDKGKPFTCRVLRSCAEETGQKPPVIQEATGHYQTPVVQYLDKRGYLLIIINRIRQRVQV